MNDPYLYEGSSVLRNLLNIHDETYSEFEHLEKILLDAICTDPIEYADDLDQEESIPQGEKYQKYQTEDYKPITHEYRADDGETKQ